MYLFMKQIKIKVKINETTPFLIYQEKILTQNNPLCILFRVV